MDGWAVNQDQTASAKISLAREKCHTPSCDEISARTTPDNKLLRDYNSLGRPEQAKTDFGFGCKTHSKMSNWLVGKTHLIELSNTLVIPVRCILLPNSKMTLFLSRARQTRCAVPNDGNPTSTDEAVSLCRFLGHSSAYGIF